MTPKEEINKIISEQYNNFKGKRWEGLRNVHVELWIRLGNEKYLEYLKQRKIDNPKPVYTPNPQFFKP